ncbi:anti-sigma regulatory factor [bacterium]|nr:anti-sigma regulatory factor [bacterium]MBU1937162.1 anti-sigma regulatory factor [bacterium]
MPETELLRRTFEVIGSDFDSAGEVSTEVKSLLVEIGVDSATARRVARASFEAEMNQVMYADKGTVELIVTDSEVQMTFQDEGQGIENIELAMQPGYSTSTDWMRAMGFGLGMGLPNIKEISDEMYIESTPNVGTLLRFTIKMDNA